MIPLGYEIIGDMVPRVRSIWGVPDRRDIGPQYELDAMHGTLTAVGQASSDSYMFISFVY